MRAILRRRRRNAKASELARLIFALDDLARETGKLPPAPARRGFLGAAR